MTRALAARSIDRSVARRIAVAAQFLDGRAKERGHRGVEAVARRLNCLQLDPTSVVARNEYLVLWSRLGTYDRSVLDRACWERRTMFEYWAHAASLVMTEDFPIHEASMRAIRTGRSSWHTEVRAWVQANRRLRDHVLRELEQHGPVPASHFSDVSDRAWRSSGWTNERNVQRMLDFLWLQGRILVSTRTGAKRSWDLAERVLPDWTPRERLAPKEVARRRTQLALRSLGIGTERQIRDHFIRWWWRSPHLTDTLQDLGRDGTAQRLEVRHDGEALPGRWWVHRDYAGLLEVDGEGRAPHTTLLSPFDHLIRDRGRTEQLFDFRYRIEIYVPKAKRRYGYFAMPLLHGDALVGRVDVRVDREARVLHALSVHAEDGAPGGAGPGVRSALEDLAAFCGAESVVAPKGVPAVWRRALRA